MRLDRLFVGGKILTMDPRRPRATRLGVIGGRIVGLDEDVDGIEADEIVDLGGLTVTPGFNDAHFHVSSLGYKLGQIDLRSNSTPDLDALLGDVSRALRAGGEGWILGWGYDDRVCGGHPTRAMLDRVSPERPVWLHHMSGHMGVVNTAAWLLAGSPPEAVEGSGLLLERDQNPVLDLIKPLPSDQWRRAIGRGAAEASAMGITSATEPGIGGTGLGGGNGPSDLDDFQSLWEEGGLPIRMTLMPKATLVHELVDSAGNVRGVGMDLGLRTGMGGEGVRIGPLKFFVDGSLVGGTAALSSGAGSGNLLWDPDELTRVVTEVHRAGWQIAAHAIGDVAIDITLDAIEAAQRSAPRRHPRHRIEHCAVTSDEALSRIQRLGVIPVPQGIFVEALGDAMTARLSDEELEICYRQASFIRAGVTVPGSSDCPVADGAPLHGIHAMVNRATESGLVLAPHERLGVHEALRCFTIGSARAQHRESDLGSLERGKLADMVVLSSDPLTTPAERLREIEVVRTIVDGRTVFDAA